MGISWGYSPKTEKFIPLSDFPADKYLIIVRQAIENLGWKLSHVSESGIIAYTPLSFQSYSEEISVRIQSNFAVVKSECVGIQLLFNDYGKNEANLEKLFHEFEYVQYHLQDQWDAQVAAFHEYAAQQDDGYFERAPLAVKNKIKNAFYLLYPQKGYKATPLLVLLNALVVIGTFVGVFVFAFILTVSGVPREAIAERFNGFSSTFGVLNRKLVLDGEYWRLLSYQFLHGSFRHLFFNMYAFVYLGLMVENKLGWKKFLLIYILSGVCAGLTSIAYHENVYTIGSSGAVMGLFGAMLALLLKRFFEPNANKALLVSTVFVLLIMLVNGSINRTVDNACHIGGLVAGFIMTYILVFDEQWEFGKRIPIGIKYANVGVVFSVFSYVVIAFTPQYQHEEFRGLKAEFDRNMKAFDQVLWMKNNYSKAEKEQYVYEHGIGPSKANLEVTKKMAALKLNQQYTLDRALKTVLAHDTHEAALLLLKDVKSDHQYKKEVSDKINDLMQKQIRFRDSLGHISEPFW